MIQHTDPGLKPFSRLNTAPVFRAAVCRANPANKFMELRLPPKGAGRVYFVDVLRSLYGTGVSICSGEGVAYTKNAELWADLSAVSTLTHGKIWARHSGVFSRGWGIGISGADARTCAWFLIKVSEFEQNGTGSRIRFSYTPKRHLKILNRCLAVGVIQGVKSRHKGRFDADGWAYLDDVATVVLYQEVIAHAQDQEPTPWALPAKAHKSVAKRAKTVVRELLRRAQSFGSAVVLTMAPKQLRQRLKTLLEGAPESVPSTVAQGFAFWMLHQDAAEVWEAYAARFDPDVYPYPYPTT